MLIETSGQVVTSLLTDGMIVRLCGDVADSTVAVLRDTLLTALPAGCRDVVVDAGEVTSITSGALAVLFAGWAWAEEHDGRFLLSRTSAAFDAVLADHGVPDELPRLTPLPTAAGTDRSIVLEAVPRPRCAGV
jgi:anti-anti-sigma regulatory factor